MSQSADPGASLLNIESLDLSYNNIKDAGWTRFVQGLVIYLGRVAALNNGAKCSFASISVRGNDLVGEGPVVRLVAEEGSYGHLPSPSLLPSWIHHQLISLFILFFTVHHTQWYDKDYIWKPWTCQRTPSYHLC